MKVETERSMFAFMKKLFGKKHEAHPLNCDGPFYVENQCCLFCDLPMTLAPDMFKYTEDRSHCYVYQQPQSDEQLQRMIEVMDSADLVCIRCRSRDKALLKLLKEKGVKQCCD